jgi:hypothetical protein
VFVTVLLQPLYALLRRIPSTPREAERHGLARRDQMVAGLVHAVEQPPAGVRVVAVPEIRLAPRVGSS